jgi:hypothetical protein
MLCHSDPRARRSTCKRRTPLATANAIQKTYRAHGRVAIFVFIFAN